MTVLGIAGSKRKNGNTALLVKTALEEIRAFNIETEMIYLSDYTFDGCCGCEGCKDNFQCVIEDDMQVLYPKILKADALVVGSPTYFYNISADMKAFLERLYPFEIFDETDRSVWLSYHEVTRPRYAAVIAVCEQESANDMGFTAEAMALPLQALGYRVVDTVKALHLFKKNESTSHPGILKLANRAGNKLAKTLLLHQKLKERLS